MEVGDIIEYNELVYISLNGFSPLWQNCLKYVVEKSYLTSSGCGMPSLERI